MKLVEIEWADSRQPTGGWERLAEMPKREYCLCRSVGWLIQDDRNVKALAATVADLEDEPQAMGIVTIPTTCVLRVKLLTSSSRLASKRTPQRT